MSTYGVMKSTIEGDTLRSDIPNEIADSITSAIKKYRDRRFFFNVKARQDRALTSGVRTIALPDDFRRYVYLKTIYNGVDYIIEPDTYEMIEALDFNNQSQQQPYAYAIFGSDVYFYPTPNQAFALRESYVYDLAALSSDGDTNAWMTDGFELIRCEAKFLLYTHILMDAKEAAKFRGMADREFARLVSESVGRSPGGLQRSW